MTGEKEAIAEMPGEEEITDLVVKHRWDDAWDETTAKAILALFAPILAEKDEHIAMLQAMVSDSLYSKRQALEARALAAEAALAKEKGVSLTLAGLVAGIETREELDQWVLKFPQVHAALAAERERLAVLVEDACATPPADIAGMELEAFHRGADAMNNAIATALRAQGE